MSTAVKTTLIVGGTILATGAILNHITDGAVVDAINDMVHGTKEVVDDIADSVGDVVNDAVEAIEQ